MRNDETSGAQRLRPGWLLWADWCLATGRTSLVLSPEALDAFAAQVPGRHLLADIRRTATDVGLPWPFAPEALDPWTRPEAGLLPLDDALRRCEQAGWPAGYRGRRDAWLLVLTRGLRMSRRQALAVTAHDLDEEDGRIVRVSGRLLAESDDPAVCHRCIAHRWVTCLAEEHRWGRSAVREALVIARATRDEADDHACHTPLGPIDDLLRTGPDGSVVPLAPAIDQHGWTADWRPMTPRAVTAVIAERCSPDFLVVIDEEEAALREAARLAREDSGTGRGFDETTFERLDAACDAADEVNERVAALLADTEAVLASTGAAHKPSASA